MTWETGTTADHNTALDKLIDVATGDHLLTATINSGGSGYSVDDVVTLVGGGGQAATLLVTAVSGGAVTGIRKLTGGAYTATPTPVTGTPTSSAGGTGLTLNTTYSTGGWSLLRREYRGQSITINNGGTGYAVNNRIELVGGTGTVTAVMRVTSVSGGVITGLEFQLEGERGRYTVRPSDPTPTTAQSGSGTGATVTLTWGQDVIMQGQGDGTQQIPIAIRTYESTDQSGFSTTYNWQLFAMTEYNSGLEFYEQPNLSPGLSASFSGGEPQRQTIVGAYLPLRDADVSYPITFFFNITPRSMVFVFKVEDAVTTIYSSGTVGYLNGLGTTTDLPFPMYVGGSSHRANVYYKDVSNIISSIVEGGGNTGDSGAGFIYRPSQGKWAGIQNFSNGTSGTSRSIESDSSIYPGGRRNQNEAPGTAVSVVGWGDWEDFIASGVPGAPTFRAMPSPGGIYWLVECVVMDHDDNEDFYQPIGEIRDTYWLGRGGVLTAEDTITVGDDVYRVFQSGNLTQDWQYFCIRETF